MTPHFFPRFIGSDRFETKIERAIESAADLYDLDGETFLRVRNGMVVTGDAEILEAF